MFWKWLRNKVRESVLAGVADAVEHLEQGDTADLRPVVVALDARLHPCLPAPLPTPSATTPKRPTVAKSNGNGKAKHNAESV